MMRIPKPVLDAGKRNLTKRYTVFGFVLLTFFQTFFNMKLRRRSVPQGSVNTPQVVKRCSFLVCKICKPKILQRFQQFYKRCFVFT